MSGVRTLPAPRWMLLATLGICLLAPLLTLVWRTAGAPPERYVIFLRLFFFNDHVSSIAMLLALLLALAWLALQGWVVRLAEWIGDHPVTTCALAFVALAAGARFVYLAHPLSMDEYAPMLQAQAFAHGQLAAQYPPMLLDSIVVPSFQNYFIFVNRATGDAMSAYWPGQSLMLAPLARIDMAWCLNPALSALALWLIGDLAARSGLGAGSRGWAMLVALASPQFTVNAMSYYSMPGVLALNLLFLWLLMRPDWRSALAAGLVGGLALAFQNPVPHALTAVPCLIWLAADRTRWRRLALVLAGYLPIGLTLGLGWPLLTAAMGMGRAKVAATNAGFVADWIALLDKIFQLPSAGLITARWYATWKMWIWACPGLLLIPFVARRRDTTYWLLLAAFVLTYAFYFLVPFDQGHGWSYRYIHPAWGALPIIAGIWFATAGPGARSFGAVAVAAGLLATPVFLWETHATIVEMLAKRIEPPADGQWIVYINVSDLYVGDLVQNLPGADRVHYFLSLGDASDRAMMEALFPDARQVIHDSRGSAWRLSEPAR